MWKKINSANSGSSETPWVKRFIRRFLVFALLAAILTVSPGPGAMIPVRADSAEAVHNASPAALKDRPPQPQNTDPSVPNADTAKIVSAVRGNGSVPANSAPKAVTRATAAATKIPVLMYHSINDDAFGLKYLSVTVGNFDLQMRTLINRGYTPVYLFDDFTQYKKPVVITFDDGYADNFTNAYPVLKKYNIKATIFLIAGMMDQPGYLSARQVGVMKDLISFQSHTVDHQNLTKLDKDKVEYECAESQKLLSQIIGQPVMALSYPNGGYSSQISAIAAKYYNCAVTTTGGSNTTIAGNYAIKRYTVSRSMSLADVLAVLSR